MVKNIILGSVAVFIAWAILDYLIHGVLLMPTYEETSELWRPVGEMKPWLMWIVNLIASVCLVSIYAMYFKAKNIKNGVVYGLLVGVAWGAGMGYGSYSYMPIPYFLAQAWFWATVVELTVAGALIGLIVKD